MRSIFFFNVRRALHTKRKKQWYKNTRNKKKGRKKKKDVDSYYEVTGVFYFYFIYSAYCPCH